MNMNKDNVDIAVIGSGFGGIGTALALAEQGASVALFETLNYPGGCASTFSKGGFTFDSGATLSSGFAPKQLFAQWIKKYQLPIELMWLDPVVRFRTPEIALDITSQPDSLLNSLMAIEGAPKQDLVRFFSHQKKVATSLWEILDQPELLPPFTLKSLLNHLSRLPTYLPITLDIGKSLADVLKRYRLENFVPLTQYLNALCQITVQCSLDEAEAPFALATMDYYSRGAAHIQGGMGKLAVQLCKALEKAGGTVYLSTRVKRLEQVNNDMWSIATSRGTINAKAVVANLLPSALEKLLPADFSPPRWVENMQNEIETGWSAAMLYLAANAPGDGPAQHWQLVENPEKPFHSGNHVFTSISSSGESQHRGKSGWRTLTLSTHIPMTEFLAFSKEDQADFVNMVQAKMSNTLHQYCPQWAEKIRLEYPASPRTFQRFTARPNGFVGGIPKRVGLRHYTRISPRPVAPNLFVTGDSMFPGQSTLATALGGTRIAHRLLTTLRL